MKQEQHHKNKINFHYQNQENLFVLKKLQHKYLLLHNLVLVWRVCYFRLLMESQISYRIVLGASSNDLEEYMQA